MAMAGERKFEVVRERLFGPSHADQAPTDRSPKRRRHLDVTQGRDVEIC